MRWQKRFRRMVVYPILLFAGCHTLLTGSPIPLWRLDRLDSPHRVLLVNHSQLELENGQKILLPFMKSLPQSNPLFEEAVANGIEVGPAGEVFGLMWLDRHCGMDPCLWRRVRVNLSDLAGALYPAGIDDQKVHPDVIGLIQENQRIDLTSHSPTHQKRHLTVFDLARMRAIRRDFEAGFNIARGSTSRSGE